MLGSMQPALEPVEVVASDDLDFDAFAAVSFGVDRKLGAGSSGVPPLPERQRGAEVTDVRGNKAFVCFRTICKKLIPMGDMQCVCGWLRPDKCVCSECSRSYDPELVSACV